MVQPGDMHVPTNHQEAKEAESLQQPLLTPTETDTGTGTHEGTSVRGLKIKPRLKDVLAEHPEFARMILAVMNTTVRLEEGTKIGRAHV